MEGIELRFKVTLHIEHPDLNPDTVTSALGLAPSFHYRKGEPRRTPNGTVRPGITPYGHWSHRFDLSGVRDLFEYLDELLARWESQREFFNRIAESGGTVLLFCGIIAAGNWDEQLSHQMAGRLAALKIDLRLDAWMNPDPQPTVSPS